MPPIRPDCPHAFPFWKAVKEASPGKSDSCCMFLTKLSLRDSGGVGSREQALTSWLGDPIPKGRLLRTYGR